MSLDARRAWIDPVGRELAQARPFVSRKVVGCLPRVHGLGTQDGLSMTVGDVAPDGVAAITVYATLTLLEVHRIGRRIPVHHRVAPPMEIDALLADAGGCEDERPERAVEG